MILEEIKKIKTTKKDIKRFSITIGIVFLLFSLYFLWQGKSNYLFFLILSTLTISSGLLFPIILKPIYFSWMLLALVIGNIMTTIILCVLYYLILVPISIITKLKGKAFLDTKINKSEESYWRYRSFKKNIESGYKKQF